MRQPFKRLNLIHVFITNGSVPKQVPLLFVLISGCKCVDSHSIFSILEVKIAELNVDQMVIDFDKTLPASTGTLSRSPAGQREGRAGEHRT